MMTFYYPDNLFAGSTGPQLFSPNLVGNVLPQLPELPPASNPLYKDEEEHLARATVSGPVPPNWDVLVRVLRPEVHEEVKS